MPKKSFSILEIIFAITIISILTAVAIPKLFYNVSNANTVKLRADVALIRNGIQAYKNRQILLNEIDNLEILEDNENLLFNLILDNPIVPKENTSGNWSSLSSNDYKAWITDKQSVDFIYNNIDLSFDCDFSQEYCKDLTQ